MARYNFKGDVETVSQAHLEFINNVLEKKGYKGPDVLIEAVGEAGDNYIADVMRVVIKENGGTFKMIAKLAPDISIMRQTGQLETLFYNEHIIYTELLPKFRELQRNAGVPEREWFRFGECYGSNNKVPHEVILLEDLKDDNYVMLDRFKPLTNDCLKMVLQKLAIFHSLSYVLKHQEPETFDAIKSKLENMMTTPRAEHDGFRMYFQQLEQEALAVVQGDKYKKLIKGNVGDIFHHATKVEKADSGSKHTIIQHGDSWTNNILFKIEDEIPVNCVLIDFQLARESNPAYDIMYMIFNSTDHEQRQKHYFEFIDYYHSELDKSLHNYGLKASFVFSRDQLDADLKRYAKFIFATSVMVSSFITRKSEDAIKVKENMKNATMDSGSSEDSLNSTPVPDQETMLLFKRKIEGLVDSFLEFGLLHTI